MPFFDKYETNLLKSLIDAKVTFAIFGGAAVSLHGVKRERHDLDLLIEDTVENKQRLLDNINFPRQLRQDDAAKFLQPKGMWKQASQDDFRGFDIASEVSGIDNTACLSSVVWLEVDDMDVPVASVASLIANKEALGDALQDEDLADLKALRLLGL